MEYIMSPAAECERPPFYKIFKVLRSAGFSHRAHSRGLPAQLYCSLQRGNRMSQYCMNEPLFEAVDPRR